MIIQFVKHLPFFGVFLLFPSIGLTQGVELLPIELVEERDPFDDIAESVTAKRKEQRKSLPTQSTARNQNEAPSRPSALEPDARAQLTTDSQSGNFNESETTTILNVKEADIATLVKTFSKLTGRNYIVDNNVKGKVTIHLQTPVTVSEALRIFDSVLLLKGFTTVPLGKNVWKVVSAKDAKQTTIPLLLEQPEIPSDQLVTQLVRLKHVAADDLRQLLSQFVSPDGIMNSFPSTNALILIDSSANIKRLQELINELDVPAVNQDITIIPVLHADANDISNKIKEILGEDEDKQRVARQSAARTAINQSRRQRSRSSNAQSQTSEQRSLPIKIIPDERTNSLIVVADEALTDKVKALVEQLDSPVDLSGGRFWVYRLEHADAEEIAQIMNDLISGAGDNSSSSSRSSTGSSISRNRQQAQQNTTAASSRLTQALQRRTRLAQAALGQGESRVSFEGEVSIAPDPATNSLIINASRADYLRLKDVIASLDMKRPQVIVEATILEVSLNEEEGMGVELQGTAGTSSTGIVGQTNFGSLTNLLTNPGALTDLTIAAASTGTLTLPGGLTIPSQAILISAISTNQHVNVLSAPTILTTDNEEAEIIVGENVPFVTSTSTDPTNLGNTFNQIERQDVGITLRITPQISTGSFVTLKIFVEISNVVAGTRNDPNGPTTTIRTTDTTVEVKDGQMIVTGGLISDNVTNSTRGVPFFENIPVLGQYFQRQDEVRRRTNLLIFITPRILKDQYDAREASIESRDGLHQTIEYYGSQPSREEILFQKSLDNVAESVSKKTPRPTTITPPNTRQIKSEKENAALSRTFERLNKLTTEEKKGPKKEKASSLPKQESKSKPSKAREDDEVLEITVTPEIPSSAKSTAPKITTPRAQLGTPPKSSPLGNLRTYVVLKDISGTKLPSGTLTYADKSGTLGLIVLGSLESQANKFFEVGRRYTYKDNKEARKLVVLGKFASPEEAKIMHPTLGKENHWHPLSPRDTLALGNGPWQKG